MMSFADDRRLIKLAGSIKSLEAVAKRLAKEPKAVAKAAKRLGVSLKASKPAAVEDAWLIAALGPLSRSLSAQPIALALRLRLDSSGGRDRRCTILRSPLSVTLWPSASF